MATVKIISGDRISTGKAKIGESLLAVLQREGAEISAPCGGAHICGKCLVRVEGQLSAVSDEESRLLPESGLRLACCARVLDDCSVHYEENHSFDVVTSVSHTELPLGESVLDGGYGIAVDVGTTTIAVYLMKDGETAPMDSYGAYNNQRKFGADVLSRIVYANENGNDSLGQTVRAQLGDLFLTLCRRNKVEPAQVKRAVITGNTTMLHFICDLDATGISLAPFTPNSLFGCWTQVALDGFPTIEVYYPPCISAYIGADISCGILLEDLERRKGNVLYLDVGTNGEMILSANGTLLGCSTAAGPAFEGAGISCGSGAIPGAISRVLVKNGEMSCKVLGGQEGKSLCGSGLIDAVAAFKGLGIIDRNGKMSKEYGGKHAIGRTNVYLSQKDVRELQLAKGAIRAGMDTLLAENGLDYDELDEIILAGGFGSFIEVASAVEIGLFPESCRSKVTVVGNAAGAGAGALLLDQTAFERISNLAKKVNYIELSGHHLFTERFMKRMVLEP